VTNVGNDTSQLAHMAKQAKAVLDADTLEVIADRGYFSGDEILACEQADITVTLPKPLRSGAKAQGRFGKQDFAYLHDRDVYRCPADELLIYRYTREQDGKNLGYYWTSACSKCPIRSQCTTGPERRVARWEHEHVVEAVQRRLDDHPEKMRVRRETVEHPFATLKERMGATHFLTKAAQGRYRDGAQRARLQSDARHEHRRRQAADRGDRRVEYPGVCLSRLGRMLRARPAPSTRYYTAKTQIRLGAPTLRWPTAPKTRKRGWPSHEDVRACAPGRTNSPVGSGRMLSQVFRHLVRGPQAHR
jgi:DDE family transposase